MIDTLGILLTCLACLYVAIRAVQLDAMLPWFQPPRREAGAPDAAVPGEGAGPATPSPGARPRRAAAPAPRPARPGGWRARAWQDGEG
ncbi:hypothetical protein [Siccirubricoccus phaeus]|uniref:hypothetical protein n=1 Tax=Siccirubricoccus phaeus TaxID=2595053 RepID=UPI0011F3180E|nr:hypothetical protein [Siccirubricoccus phaeus]